MRILLAEDEISLAKAIKKILQSNNYEVDSVDNGDDAIYYLLSDNYDIAIIDIIFVVKNSPFDISTKSPVSLSVMPCPNAAKFPVDGS